MSDGLGAVDDELLDFGVMALLPLEVVDGQPPRHSTPSSNSRTAVSSSDTTSDPRHPSLLEKKAITH
jgi:hypothetical protein